MIPDWLAPWWNWWAAFTDLLDWDAIAAIATAGALVWALWSADRTRRAAATETRLRSIKLMKAMLVISANGIHAVHTTLDHFKNQGLPPRAAAAQALNVDNIAEVQRTLESFSASDLHSTVAIDLLMSARTGMRDLRKTLEQSANGGDVGGEINGLLGYWEKLLLGIATEVVRLGGRADPADNLVTTFWIAKAKGSEQA